MWKDQIAFSLSLLNCQWTARSHGWEHCAFIAAVYTHFYPQQSIVSENVWIFASAYWIYVGCVFFLLFFFLFFFLFFLCFHGTGLARLSLLALHRCTLTWASNWLKTEWPWAWLTKLTCALVFFLCYYRTDLRILHIYACFYSHWFYSTLKTFKWWLILKQKWQFCPGGGAMLTQVLTS